MIVVEDTANFGAMPQVLDSVDNDGDRFVVTETLIDELTLIYNKNRQAAITKELSEIVGGAAAV